MYPIPSFILCSNDQRNDPLYGVYLLFSILFWVNVGRAGHNGREAGRILPEPPRLTLPLFSKIPQDLVNQNSHRTQKKHFPTFVFCFIRMVGGLICDECVCIECVIRQMFSFPDHSGCMGSMALMFHSQWYLSLTSSQMPLSIQENEMPRSRSQSSVQPFSSPPGRRSYKLVT